jgi:hypothetical protein
MAEKEEIEILISPEGDIKFHMKGIVGPACKDTAKALAAEIGEIKEFIPTSDYYRKDVVKSNLHGKNTL